MMVSISGGIVFLVIMVCKVCVVVLLWMGGLGWNRLS